MGFAINTELLDKQEGQELETDKLISYIVSFNYTMSTKFDFYPLNKSLCKIQYYN
jgi:hypothetical protein